MLPEHIYSWVSRETASDRFKWAISDLEGKIKSDAERHREKIEQEYRRIIGKWVILRDFYIKEGSESEIDSANKEIEAWNQILEEKKSLNFFLVQAPIFFVLHKAGSPLLIDFAKEASKKEFWDEGSGFLREDPHILWYVLSMGISNEFTDMVAQSLKTGQTVVGRLSAQDTTHPGALRVLVKADPLSESTLKAAQYWVEIAREYEDELKSRCLGVLALTELDFEHYKSFIMEEAEWIRDLQLDDGSFSTESSCSSELPLSLVRFDDTCYAIWALSTALSPEDRSVQKAVSWIHQIIPDPGHNFADTLHYWFLLDYPEETLLRKALALIALLSVGEGPKVPMEWVEVEMMKQRQNLQHYKPKFLHTSPIYIGGKAVKEIHEQIDRMLKNARKIIRISSPFIDVFYDEIANLLKERPELVVKIVARPEGDITGPRGRIAKNAIDQLRISTRGNVVTSKLVHSRLIIIDKDEMLVSSADLTRDSLFDEFNAGIWTRDKKAISEAIEFFDNLYDYSKNLRGSAR